MIKRYSKHLIGYGSLLFFLGLFTLGVDAITVNIIIPFSTILVVLGTLGWIFKPKNKERTEIKYASKADQGLGYLWNKVIPKFWTGMVLLLMIIFNPFASKIHKQKRNFLIAQELSYKYEPITKTFGSELHFGDVNAWSYPNDTTTTFKFKLRGNEHNTELVELTLSHGEIPHLTKFEIASK